MLVWMSVPGADGAIVRAGLDQPWPMRMYWNVRASMRQHLAAVGDRQDGHLLNALIVGDRHPALARLNRTMVRAGIAHLLIGSTAERVVRMAHCPVLVLRK